MSTKIRFAKHLKRTTAQMKAMEEAPGVDQAMNEETRIVLNELTPNGLVLYSAKPVPVGQEISLTIDQPKRISTRARILACHEYQLNQTIVSSKPFKYRIFIEFVSSDDEQRKEIADYYELVQKEVRGLPQAA